MHEWVRSLEVSRLGGGAEAADVRPFVITWADLVNVGANGA
jgi:hypothetical protein